MLLSVPFTLLNTAPVEFGARYGVPIVIIGIRGYSRKPATPRAINKAAIKPRTTRQQVPLELKQPQYFCILMAGVKSISYQMRNVSLRLVENSYLMEHIFGHLLFCLEIRVVRLLGFGLN